MSPNTGSGAPPHTPQGSSENGAGTGTLGKIMTILDLVAEAEEPPRFTEILARSGQPRGTLHRQLSHMVEEGLLELRRDMTYAPGLRLLSLAARAWARNDFRSIAQPHLRDLHDLTGETVHLGALRGSTIVYVDKVEGRQSAVRMYSQVGNASPVYCTGIGKAALSAMEDRALSALVSQLEFRPFTASTHKDACSLLDDIATIRVRGHAFDLEEHESGICCVAASIVSDDHSFIGGLSVTGPAYRVTSSDLETWAPLVRDAALRIMRDMNARLGPRR